MFERNRMCTNGNYVAYKRITLSSFLLYLLKKTCIHCHSCLMVAIKFVNIFNDQVNYDDIIIK